MTTSISLLLMKQESFNFINTISWFNSNHKEIIYCCNNTYPPLCLHISVNCILSFLCLILFMIFFFLFHSCFIIIACPKLIYNSPFSLTSTKMCVGFVCSQFRLKFFFFFSQLIESHVTYFSSSFFLLSQQLMVFVYLFSLTICA